MAVKRRYVECECGETYNEGKNNSLEGTVALGPWRLKENRKRSTKTNQGSDILIGLFERSVHCGKCKQELMKDRRQYEVTPPSPGEDPVTSYVTREFVMKDDKIIQKDVDALEIEGRDAVPVDSSSANLLKDHRI